MKEPYYQQKVILLTVPLWNFCVCRTLTLSSHLATIRYHHKIIQEPQILYITIPDNPDRFFSGIHQHHHPQLTHFTLVHLDIIYVRSKGQVDDLPLFYHMHPHINSSAIHATVSTKMYRTITVATWCFVLHQACANMCQVCTTFKSSPFLFSELPSKFFSAGFIEVENVNQMSTHLEENPNIL